MPIRPPNETNHQGNQRLLLVRNATVESENKTRTIKAAVQPAIGGLHTCTFMEMIGGKTSIKMARLGGRFKYEGKNSMAAEAL